MTPHQQKIQSLVDNLACELRKQYFYRLIVKDKPAVPIEAQAATQIEDEPNLAEPNHEQDYPLMVVPVEHEKNYEIVSSVYIPDELKDKLSAPLLTSRSRSYLRAPNIKSSADLAELFRIPEDFEYFQNHGMKLLSDPYIHYGSKYCDIDIDALSQAMHGNCLVQLTNGKITLRYSKDISGSKDIVAVLAFPSDMTSFCEYIAYYVPVDNLDECGQIHSMSLSGIFSDLPNLVYVPPIPEGVTDLQFAFQGCPKLNCPIHIPSTATRLFGMLNECDSFSSEIFIHSAQKEIPGLSSLPVQATWLTEV